VNSANSRIRLPALSVQRVKSKLLFVKRAVEEEEEEMLNARTPSKGMGGWSGPPPNKTAHNSTRKQACMY